MRYKSLCLYLQCITNNLDLVIIKTKEEDFVSKFLYSSPSEYPKQWPKVAFSKAVDSHRKPMDQDLIRDLKQEVIVK